MTYLSAYRNKITDRLFGVIHLKSSIRPTRGNVLLSYLTEPFKILPGESLSTYHTSYWECQEMAQIFLSRGYDVDVISHKNRLFIPKKCYAFAIDVDTNLQRLSKLLNKECKKIFHITAAYWKFQNDAEEKRLTNLWKRKGVKLISRRTLEPSKSAECADYLEGLGGDFANETYRFIGKSIYSIPVSTVSIYKSPKDKNFDQVKKKYLWTGGGGAVLKGLDIVLDTFKALPDYRLTVCGPVDAEEDFISLYKTELYETPNIKYHGRINTTGEEFRKILDESLAVISVSASEGAGAAAIQAMHAGLIPIATRESAVPAGDFGIPIKEPTVQSLTRAIQELSSESTGDLRSRAGKSWEYARRHHTREAFSRAYSSFVDTILHA